MGHERCWLPFEQLHRYDEVTTLNTVQHPRFDLSRFSGLFPLQELRGDRREQRVLEPRGQVVTSPYHLTVVELLRREAFKGVMPEHAIPVDVFVFGAGEPEAPYHTKFGGIPFRSRRKSWPESQNGKRLGFVGQLSFIDSMDLVSALPGDLLLIFCDPARPMDVRAYVFQWVTLSEPEPMTAGDVPEVRYLWTPGLMARRRGEMPEDRRFEVFPCYGVIHRTVDLPGLAVVFENSPAPFRVTVIEATKIGGVAHYVQGLPAVDGRFIASLASVQPAVDVAFPWSNHPDRISLMDRRSLSTWKFGDIGSLCIFDDKGRIRVDAQSY
jgi:hypothetical protein